MFSTLTPVTRNIIILCGIVYAISNFVPSLDLYRWFSAFYPFSPNFRSWQVLTHMFMHAPLGDSIGLMHILFNMLTLWSFGPVLEQTLGSRKFTVLYFASGLGAFLLFNVWNFYEVNMITSALEQAGINVGEIFHKADFSYSGDLQNPGTNAETQNLVQQLFIALRSPMLGASGAIFGIVAAFATLFPDAKLAFMFIPFPIKAKYLLPFIIAVSLYLQFSGQMGGVAHLAHIGGAVVGFVFALIWKKNRYRINR